ncbi:hypothetical protein Tco_0768135 [Tanacetum coccineum]
MQAGATMEGGGGRAAVVGGCVGGSCSCASVVRGGGCGGGEGCGGGCDGGCGVVLLSSSNHPKSSVMDDLRLHISSSSGSSTPLSSYSGTSTCPSYSPGTSRSAQNLGKAECSNCKFLAEKIKTLEAKIKILEGALEMERHPEKHTLELAAILHELYNDMGKLDLE